MAVISSLFGYWQNSIVAGIFMFTFLFFLEKLFRVLVDVIARK